MDRSYWANLPESSVKVEWWSTGSDAEPEVSKAEVNGKNNKRETEADSLLLLWLGDGWTRCRRLTRGGG